MTHRPLLCLCLAVLLGACATPSGITLTSPLPTPGRDRPVFLPLAAADSDTTPATEWAKKGCSGCTCAQMEALGAAASYTWSPFGSLCPTGKPIYPMIWGSRHLNPADLEAAWTAARATGWLMGYNEPDQTAPGSSGMAMDAAVEGWLLVEAACSPPCRLVAPAPAGGARWLADWRAAFHARFGRYPRIDALAVHCYLDLAGCKAKVREYQAFGRDIGVTQLWITEWATLPGLTKSKAQAQAEGDKFVTFAARQAQVDYLFIFTAQVNPCDAWAGGQEWNRLFNGCTETPAADLSDWGRWWAATGPK
jgi:hypothetical protein